MKKLFSFLTAFFLTAVAFAQQIPNTSFESWQTKTGIGFTGPYTYEIPQNWQLGFISDLTSTFGMKPNVGKSTVAASGTYALKLASNADTIGADLTTTFPLGPNAKPSTFIGQFRTSGVVTDPNDYGQAYIFLTKWNGTSRDTIGFGVAVLDSSPNAFKQFSAPISYMNTAIPDTAIAYLLYFPQEANTFVMVDNVSFVYVLGTPKETSSLAQFNLFPNPVSDHATITFNAATSGNGLLVIRDLTGKEIKTTPLENRQTGSNTLSINTSDLKTGIYTATIQTTKSTQTLRFVKR